MPTMCSAIPAAAPTRSPQSYRSDGMGGFGFRPVGKSQQASSRASHSSAGMGSHRKTMGERRQTPVRQALKVVHGTVNVALAYGQPAANRC
jgi:hypothetical protein